MTRTAIVTGAASGIGRALASELAAAGVRVVLADRQVDAAEQAAQAIRAAGGAARAAALDVRSAAAFRTLVEETVAADGRLDYLFNNAGIAVGGPAEEFSAADWDEVIDVNLRGVANGILAAYPVMIRQGGGHIVNTASLAGLTAVPLQISYVATKHAVVGLSKALRLEGRRHGVRVSVVCPGAIRTPILAGGTFGRFTPSFDPVRVAEMAAALRPSDPVALARRVLRAVARNRAVIVEPPRWRPLWYLERLSPRLAERLSAALLRRVERRLAEPHG